MNLFFFLHFRGKVYECLIEDGYLISTEEQLSSIGIDVQGRRKLDPKPFLSRIENIPPALAEIAKLPGEEAKQMPYKLDPHSENL